MLALGRQVENAENAAIGEAAAAGREDCGYRRDRGRADRVAIDIDRLLRDRLLGTGKPPHERRALPSLRPFREVRTRAPREVSRLAIPAPISPMAITTTVGSISTLSSEPSDYVAMSAYHPHNRKFDISVRV